MSRYAVDKISVLDGVVIAKGWSEELAPQIVLGGVRVEKQCISRHLRPDVATHLGSATEAEYGFVICAIPSDSHFANSEIAVVFEDGIEVRSSSPQTAPNADDLFVDFKKLVNSSSQSSSLIELGSRARSGNTYREHFPAIKNYTGVDISAGDNVDLVGDLHQLSSIVDHQYDFAFSISVFEHLLMPWVAALELNKTLSQGGIAYIQSHPAYPLHDEPWDFFRFSKEAWHGLFNNLTGFKVIDTAYSLPASIVPNHAMSGPLQDIDKHPTYLISACLIEKTAPPEVDWSCDPSKIYNLGYSH